MLCSYTLKDLISSRGQGFLRINHFMQPFTMTCKQAGIVVANDITSMTNAIVRS